MSIIGDKQVIALDLQGWKIVAKAPRLPVWFFDSRRSEYPCPEWCEDQAGGNYPRRRPFQTFNRSRPAPKSSEEEWLEWASDVLSKITDGDVALLDSQGWKIVNKADPNRRWPYGVNDISYACPDWCEDLAALPDSGAYRRGIRIT